MEIKLISVEQSRSFSVPTVGILTIPMDDGTVTRLHVELQDGTEITDGDLIFNVALNGVLQFAGSERLIIPESSDPPEVTKDSLSIEVEEGDMLRLDVESIPMDELPSPIGFFITYDNGRTIAYEILNSATEDDLDDTDLFPFVDTTDDAPKKTNWANLKAKAKTYFDTLYQPLNAVLTAFAALSPSNDDFLQRKSGAWANRTIAQVKTDLSLPSDTVTALTGKVATTGDETVAGVKTFSSSPIVPTPTTNFQTATKKYVDDQFAGAGTGDMVKATYDTDNDGVVDMSEDIQSGAITGKSAVTVATGDYLLIADVSDSNNLKKVTAQSIADLAASPLAQNTSTVTTGSLADDAEETGTVSLGKISMVMRVVADRACRVRLYATSAYRTADSSRIIGVDPTGEHGLLLEVVIEAGNLTLDLSPVAVCHNRDGTPASNIYYAITNLSGSTHTVQVTFTKLTLEA